MFMHKNAVRLATSVFVVLSLLDFVSGALAGANMKPDRISQLANIPSPCISIKMGKVTAALSISDLEHLANATPPSWATEPERLAMITGNRAKEILVSASGSFDSHACLISSGNIGDGGYLIAHMLEEGKATVLNNKTGVIIPEITVKNPSMNCGLLCGSGSIEFYFPESNEPFFTKILWIS